MKASDANGIAGITGKIGNATVFTAIHESTAGKIETWRASCNFTAANEGEQPLTVELTDKAGSKSQFTRTIIMDTQAPTVTLT